MNAGLQPHIHTKINSRCTVDVDVKGKPIKCIEYNRRGYLCDPGVGNDFSNKNKTASTSKEKRGQLSYINIKNFVQTHHSKNEKSSQSSESENIYNVCNCQWALVQKTKRTRN